MPCTKYHQIYAHFFSLKILTFENPHRLTQALAHHCVTTKKGKGEGVFFLSPINIVYYEM